MMSWILLANPVIETGSLKDAMIYFQSSLPWILMLTGILLQHGPKRSHRSRWSK